MCLAWSQRAEAAAGPASRDYDRRPAATLDSPALLARLHQDLLTNPATELALTRARRQLCLDLPAAPTPLAAAITAQGSLNEYVWSVTEEESAALASAPAWVRAMYGPTLADPELLQRAQRIPALTEVTAGTSTAVRQMYEENPYPRWHRLSHRTPHSLDQSLHELTMGEFDPPDFLRQPRLLVAGCGTGREMLTAATAWRPANVTGFDLSRVSLAYAQQMAEQLGVEVDLYQADLLELGDWDRQFDAIVCTGVLHHLDDPVSGWCALVQLLRPGGVMLVGLYSRQARAGIRVAQADVRRAGWQPTPVGIRNARTQIMELPREHPGRDCTRLGDFYSLSGCRDMLFHVREHNFTLPEVAAALDKVGLEFCGFQTDDDTMRRYRTLFGSPQHLEYWDTLERLYPHTFLGMYQFWCRRSDVKQQDPSTCDPAGREGENDE